MNPFAREVFIPLHEAHGGKAVLRSLRQLCIAAGIRPPRCEFPETELLAERAANIHRIEAFRRADLPPQFRHATVAFLEAFQRMLDAAQGLVDAGERADRRAIRRLLRAAGRI